MRYVQFSVVALLLSTVISGCVTTKRGMLQDNIYYSEKYPNMRIAVYSEFSHEEGGGYGHYDHIFRWNSKALMIGHFNFHVLQNKLDYYNHPHHWIYSGIPDNEVFAKGETRLLGKTWYYAYAIHEKDGRCSMVKYLRRFTDDHNVFLIKYIMRGDGYTCRNWERSWKSTPYDSEEKNDIKERIDQSFDRAVTITAHVANIQK